jgi:hypothetical protein
MSASGARTKRASRTAIRVWAWVAGVLSFLTPYGLLGLWPKPAEAASATTTTTAMKQKPRRPVVIVVTKKIVYTKSPTTSVTSSGPVHYVYAPSTSGTATSAATATTCGTHPC